MNTIFPSPCEMVDKVQIAPVQGCTYHSETMRNKLKPSGIVVTLKSIPKYDLDQKK